MLLSLISSIALQFAELCSLHAPDAKLFHEDSSSGNQKYCGAVRFGLMLITIVSVVHVLASLRGCGFQCH